MLYQIPLKCAMTITSIEGLNTKAWFRLLKVLYVLGAIVIAFFLIVAASQIATTEDQASIEAARLFASGTLVSPPQTPEEARLGFIPDVSQPPTPSYHEDWTMFVLYAAIAILIEALLFEIIRRVFYYVLLGTSVWRHRKKTSKTSGT